MCRMDGLRKDLLMSTGMKNSNVCGRGRACRSRRGCSRAAVVAGASASARVVWTLAHQKVRVALRPPGSFTSSAGKDRSQNQAGGLAPVSVWAQAAWRCVRGGGCARLASSLADSWPDAEAKFPLANRLASRRSMAEPSLRVRLGT